MTVRIHWSVPQRPLTDAALVRAAEAALVHGGRAGVDIDVVVVDDEALTALHGRFLDDPTPTDVISFDLGEDGQGPAGELYVSLECAERVSAQRSVLLERELALYVVHGTLHLCGFDDHEDADRQAMREAERVVLSALGYPPDSTPHEP